jgi:hypothetical protein
LGFHDKIQNKKLQEREIICLIMRLEVQGFKIQATIKGKDRKEALKTIARKKKV